MFRGCPSQAALARTGASSLRQLETNIAHYIHESDTHGSDINSILLKRNCITTILPQQPSQTSRAPEEPHVPLPLQAIYYKPLRRQETYGLPVCDLQLRSYSVRQLEAQADFALRAAYYLNLPAFGPVPMPKKIERWTVPRSNFVHKKSQENFERITRSRLIQIKDGHPETVELWLAFIRKHAYYGVGMKANIFSFDEIGVGKTMNVSLETLKNVSRPKWAHFGPGKTVETASMVRELLQSEKYREKPFALYPDDAPVNRQWDIQGRPLEQTMQEPVQEKQQQPTEQAPSAQPAPQAQAQQTEDEPWETVEAFKREVRAVEEATSKDEERFQRIAAEVADAAARKEQAAREAQKETEKELETKLKLTEVELGGMEHEHADIQKERVAEVKEGKIEPEVVSAEKQAQLQLQDELRRQMYEMQKEVEEMRARDRAREEEIQALRAREMERMKEQMKKDMEAQQAAMQAAMLQMQQEMMRMREMAAAPAAAPPAAAAAPPAPEVAPKAAETPAEPLSTPKAAEAATPEPTEQPAAPATELPVPAESEASSDAAAPTIEPTEAPQEATPTLNPQEPETTANASAPAPNAQAEAEADKIIESSIESQQPTPAADAIDAQSPATATESLTESLGTISHNEPEVSSTSGDPAPQPTSQVKEEEKQEPAPVATPTQAEKVPFQPEQVVDEEEVQVPKTEAPEQVRDEEERKSK